MEKNEKKSLQMLFIFEVLIVATVPFIFKMIEPKKIAALYAGSLFVVLGVRVLYVCLNHKNLRVSWLSLMGAIHLFGIAFPLLGSRLYFFDTDFDQIQILGMGAPEFHKYSEWVFIGLMLATIYEWLKIQLKKKAT